MLKTIYQIYSRGGIITILLLFTVITCLSPFNFYWRVIYSAIALIFCYDKRYLNIGSIYLLLFSIIYPFFLFLLNKHVVVTDLIFYLVGPISFYFIGQRLCSKFESDKLNLIFILILILSFGLRTYINCIEDSISNGIVNISRSLLTSVDGYVLSATLYGVTVALGFSGIATFIVSERKMSIISLGYMSVFLLSLFSVAHLINRTGIVLALISVVVAISYMSKNQGKLRLFLLMLSFFLIYKIIVYFALIPNDVVSAYLDRQSDLDTSMGGDGGRLYRWGYALERVLSKPFGWETDKFSYVHNLWLDVDRLSGIVPFLFLVCATFIESKKTLKLYKVRNNTLACTLLALCVICFTTNFIEPILEGMPLFFCLNCLIWGVQDSFLKHY